MTSLMFTSIPLFILLLPFDATNIFLNGFGAQKINCKATLCICQRAQQTNKFCELCQNDINTFM